MGILIRDRGRTVNQAGMGGSTPSILAQGGFGNYIRQGDDYTKGIHITGNDVNPEWTLLAEAKDKNVPEVPAVPASLSFQARGSNPAQVDVALPTDWNGVEPEAQNDLPVAYTRYPNPDDGQAASAGVGRLLLAADSVGDFGNYQRAYRVEAGTEAVAGSPEVPAANARAFVPSSGDSAKGLNFRSPDTTGGAGGSVTNVGGITLVSARTEVVPASVEVRGIVVTAVGTAVAGAAGNSIVVRVRRNAGAVTPNRSTAVTRDRITITWNGVAAWTIGNVITVLQNQDTDNLYTFELADGFADGDTWGFSTTETVDHQLAGGADARVYQAERKATYRNTRDPNFADILFTARADGAAGNNAQIAFGIAGTAAPQISTTGNITLIQVPAGTNQAKSAVIAAINAASNTRSLVTAALDDGADGTALFPRVNPQSAAVSLTGGRNLFNPRVEGRNASITLDRVRITISDDITVQSGNQGADGMASITITQFDGASRFNGISPGGVTIIFPAGDLPTRGDLIAQLQAADTNGYFTYELTGRNNAAGRNAVWNPRIGSPRRSALNQGAQQFGRSVAAVNPLSISLDRDANRYTITLIPTDTFNDIIKKIVNFAPLGNVVNPFQSGDGTTAGDLWLTDAADGALVPAISNTVADNDIDYDFSGGTDLVPATPGTPRSPLRVFESTGDGDGTAYPRITLDGIEIIRKEILGVHRYFVANRIGQEAGSNSYALQPGRVEIFLYNSVTRNEAIAALRRVVNAPLYEFRLASTHASRGDETWSPATTVRDVDLNDGPAVDVTTLNIEGVVALDTLQDVLDAYSGSSFVLTLRQGSTGTGLFGTGAVPRTLLLGGRDAVARQLPVVALNDNGSVSVSLHAHNSRDDNTTLNELLAAFNAASYTDGDGASQSFSGATLVVNGGAGTDLVSNQRLPASPANGENYVPPVIHPPTLAVDDGQRDVRLTYHHEDNDLQDLYDLALAEDGLTVHVIDGTDLSRAPEPAPSSRPMLLVPAERPVVEVRHWRDNSSGGTSIPNGAGTLAVELDGPVDMVSLANSGTQRFLHFALPEAYALEVLFVGQGAAIRFTQSVEDGFRYYLSNALSNDLRTASVSVLLRVQRAPPSP